INPFFTFQFNPLAIEFRAKKENKKRTIRPENPESSSSASSMADNPPPTTSAAPPDPNPPPSVSDNAAPQSDPAPASSSAPPQSSIPPQPIPIPNPNPSNPNSANTQILPHAPSPFPSAYGLPPPPPPISGASVPPQMIAPSFRPIPQFTLVPGYQNQTAAGVQPPGTGMTSAPYQPPNQILRPPYAAVPNGYPPVPGVAPPGIMPPRGLPRYPSPYPAMVRPIFTPRPPGVLPLTRPLVPNIPGVRPIIRPAVPSVTPAEKPQTTVYVGKISPSVANDFMLSLLQLCGPVKSWKRAQDPSDGTPKRFGFCEFENAEGVLRALRLLTKFNIDGQELVLNVDQATREYLDRYVERKTENWKNLREGAADAEKNGLSESSEKAGLDKSSVDDSEKDNGKENRGKHDLANFGMVTDEDKENDKAASEKLTNMIEERLKTNPLPPPPPPPPIVGSGNSSIEPTKSRDGDSDIDILSNDAGEDKNNEDASNHRATNEHERLEVSSPDNNRRYDRRSRDRDTDLKQEKDREIDRYEREAERERVRKERELRRKAEDAEREFEERLRDWEYREREKEKQRQYEKEREKEKERKRRKEILRDEEDEDDSGKRWRRSIIEEKRRRRQREKEEDLADRLKEEEEIAEAKKIAEEERLLQHEKDALKLQSADVMNGSENAASPDETVGESKHKVSEKLFNITGNEGMQNGADDVSTVPMVDSEAQRQSANAATRKLGFGLAGAGKRAAVPSVFHEDDDDDAHKDKKMRPLVPIDYSAEELQAVQPATSEAQPPNLAAAAEYAKQISNIAPKEEKSEVGREKSHRSHDRSGRRDKYDEDSYRSREEKVERDRDRDRGLDKVKTPDKQKLLNAKQLIDMIPKTKDELFSYEINWAIYDKHSLHDRMRPWISKKITEFLGEEEATLVDYIVSSTREHVKAAQMLELLQSILDDEAEMFVLKMWRMLIFEIKKVETGLDLKSKS
ncbi:RNA-binding motif protein 25, partial [Linum perenne]